MRIQKILSIPKIPNSCLGYMSNGSVSLMGGFVLAHSVTCFECLGCFLVSCLCLAPWSWLALSLAIGPLEHHGDIMYLLS